jgi:large subunit ribosomal protein L10
MLIFQHNNLKSLEWSGVRRELTKALRKVDAERVAAGHLAENLTDGIKLQVVQTGILSSALRVVEFYKPDAQPAADYTEQGDGLTHVLSKAAHSATANIKTKHALAPLLSGPLVLLTFPTVSPQHLKAAISILSPSSPQFPAPTRKANPGWHDPPVQVGIQKLLLLGARVEGKVFDVERTKWVGSIEGGLDGLRAQLVAMLQGVGAGITKTLESAAKNLYFTVETRRTMQEDEEKGISREAPKDENKDA